MPGYDESSKSLISLKYPLFRTENRGKSSKKTYIGTTKEIAKKSRILFLFSGQFFAESLRFPIVDEVLLPLVQSYDPTHLVSICANKD